MIFSINGHGDGYIDTICVYVPVPVTISILDFLSSAALFVFLSASARTWIIRIYLILGPAYGSLLGGLIFISSCNLSNLFSFHFLLNPYMIQQTDGVLLNTGDHVIEHIKGTHLIFYLWITLSVSLQTDTLTKLFHIIDVIHPLPVNDFQKYYTLQFTNLFRFRELCFSPRNAWNTVPDVYNV